MAGEEQSKAGNPLARHRAAAAQERARVKALLARDKVDRAKEAYRVVAEQQVEMGAFTNLADTVIEPTEEWLAKGPVQTFLPKQPDGTTRVISSVRRQKVPMLVKLCSQGKLSDDGFMACKLYRETYETTGLEGRVAIGRYGVQGTMPGGGSAPSQRLPITEREIMAREAFRAARLSLEPRHRKFFDAVVLNDLSPREARRGTCRNGLEHKLLAALASRLAGHYHSLGIDVLRALEGGEH